jgi:hypothetical protein
MPGCARWYSRISRPSECAHSGPGWKS